MLRLCPTAGVNQAKGVAMTTQPIASEAGPPAMPSDPEPREFPVREYIGAMALELAQMARWDGDEALGRLLDSAASLAADAPRPLATETDEPRRRRA